MGKTSSTPAMRRSTRVNIGCVVRISGTLANRAHFDESAQIVTLSKFGAKMKTRVPLEVGTLLRVEPTLGKNSGVFKVVWVGREGTPRAGEVGIENSKGVAEILGIHFPDNGGILK
jgi:hypothetical protein